MAKINEQLYTEPKVSTTGKDWYVWFRYRNSATGKMQLIIRKGGVNYKDVPRKEKLAQLNALKKAILFKLEKQGWDPVNNTYPAKTSEQIEFERLQSMGFNQALDFAFKQCDLAPKTKRDYEGTVRFFKLAAEQLGIDKTQIAEIKRKHIKALLQNIKAERKWSNHAYNKNLGYLGAILARIVDWEIIEANPAHGIKSLAVTETMMYRPLTKDEKERLREHLFINHYRFYVYLMVLYHTGIRPKEVLALKIKDINVECSEIIIIPDAAEGNSKNKKIRRVPINIHLQPFLRELKLHQYSVDYYIFGSPFGPGGNRGSQKQQSKGHVTGITGLNRNDYFLPSANKVKRDTATKLWRVVVKEKLGINKHQYALKHTGADDKILAGIELDALRELYGHSSKFMTEKYARVVKEVYRQQIVEKSPEF